VVAYSGDGQRGSGGYPLAGSPLVEPTPDTADAEPDGVLDFGFEPPVNPSKVFVKGSLSDG